MLEIIDLHAGYGRIPILHGISFFVGQGETVGVLGHNGMGKTTLVKTLMGIIKATGGRIILKDEEITRLAPFERARRGFGYVPQGRDIFPSLTVLDNLRLGAVAKGERRQEIIDEILEEFPILKKMLNRLGGALSGGEQQILAIARCLCGEPRILLLDEPTEGIQPSIIDLISEIFHQLRERLGLSVILVEQSLDFIAAHCERVLIIQKGLIARELDHSQLSDPKLFSEFVVESG